MFHGISHKYKSVTLPFILHQIRMSSTGEICVPCSGLNSNDLIPIDRLQRRLTEIIPQWNLHESRNTSGGLDYYSINRKFTAKNFQSAMDCLNEIGRIAEEQNHHPDLHITNYRDVHIELYTHKLNGVTENDIILAHAIDKRVSIEYSPKWLKSHPEVAGVDER
jgi:4a-hydroxytetrahydrobiopterin dehydratase